MPRFANGDQVETPQHGTGTVVMVWPRPNGKTIYNVSVDRKRTAIVHHEAELRAAAHVPEGRTVRCADCAQARPTSWGTGNIHCAATQRSKARSSQRLCRLFKAKPAKE